MKITRENIVLTLVTVLGSAFLLLLTSICIKGIIDVGLLIIASTTNN